MKLGYKKASELLFSSILPATRVVLLTRIICRSAYLSGEKSLHSFP